MRVFLTWSGPRSRAIASALRTWIPDVLQGVDCFMSEEDIEPGEQWLKRILDELEDSDIGILCLTPENIDARWLLYEAGFFAACTKQKRVVPLLHDLETKDVVSPLSTVQANEDLLERRHQSHRRDDLQEGGSVTGSRRIREAVREVHRGPPHRA
jgi:hypothetical protein